MSLPRCLLCSTNEEVRLNKWENNYVCLKLHLLCTPESWHAFQLPAMERWMGQCTRLYYGAIALKNTPPDWSEFGWDLSEWIWIMWFHFLLSHVWFWDLLGVRRHFGLSGKFPNFQKHPGARNHSSAEWSVHMAGFTNPAHHSSGLSWGACWYDSVPCSPQMCSHKPLSSVPHFLGLHFFLSSRSTWSGRCVRSFPIPTAVKFNQELGFLKNSVLCVCACICVCMCACECTRVYCRLNKLRDNSTTQSMNLVWIYQ